MKPTKDNTFCWYPFHQLALKEWNDKGMWNAAPCCNSLRPDTRDPLNLGSDCFTPLKQTPTEIFHGKEMSELRRALLNNERHPACTTCWKMEDRNPDNPTSYRIQSWTRDTTAEIDNPKLEVIDFAFGENCNLRCRMCAPGLSNKLRIDYNYFIDNNVDTSGISAFDWKRHFDVIREEQKNLDHPLDPKDELQETKYSSTDVANWPDEDHDWQWRNILDNIHTLKRIKATGGETTVSKPFIEFIDHAISVDAAKNISLEFHSNATKFSKTLISKLLKFKQLNINFSIDSIGKNYDYIRYPATWDILTNSLDNLDNEISNLDEMKFGNWSINVVLTALNAHYIPDLFYHMRDTYTYRDNGSISGPAGSYVFYVDNVWPDDKFISVKFLPRHIKEDLIRSYKQIQAEPEEVFKDNKFGVRPKGGIHLNAAIDTLTDSLDLEITDRDRLNMLKEITIFDKSRNQDYHDYLHPDIIEFLDNPYKGN